MDRAMRRVVILAGLAVAAAPLAALGSLALSSRATSAVFPLPVGADVSSVAAVYLCGDSPAENAVAQGRGVYMPMFAAPPSGGPVYNGPPLDGC